MPEANQSVGSRLLASLERFWARHKWLQHKILALSHHLPAALIVASLVNIGHHGYHFLGAVDGYSFLGIGNLSAIQALHHQPYKPQVEVVTIDPKSHEDLYTERSPLDRCVLAQNLATLYTRPSPPNVLVIDLDLSPVLPSRDPYIAKKETDCEQKLLELLTHTEQFASAPRTTQTILMEPFDVEDKKGLAKIVAWKEKMIAAHIQFGDPSLDVRYGLITAIECRPDSLAAKAFYAVQKAVSPKVTPDCLGQPGEIKVRGKVSVMEYADLLINPSQYLSALRPVRVSDLSTENLAAAHRPSNPVTVVFFGAGYGEDDSYLTPVGTLYGVDVHAAAYMSLLNPANGHTEVVSFLAEILFAVFLGGAISWCWRQYYKMRFSSDAWKRQFSPVFVILLGIGLLVFVLLAIAASFFILNLNYWISPVPIAIGMLVESFFNGSVHEAVHEGYKQRQALLHRLHNAHKAGMVQFSEALAFEKQQRPHEVHHLEDRFKRFIFLDVKRLYEKKKPGAALLLATRRLIFLALLIWGIYAVLKH
ncbi:MAG: hypothetical protein JWP80_1259 [Pseudomonas sp.]|nr:hypothetical protein [Pseudomonas sp.]